MNGVERRLIEMVTIYTERYENQRNLALDEAKIGGDPSLALVHATLASADATVLASAVASSPHVLAALR